MRKPDILLVDLMDLIHWARRYCDYRSTYAPSSFNAIYDRIRKDNPEMIASCDQFDAMLMDNGKYFPYAQDGMFNESNGKFDARPLKERERNETHTTTNLPLS